MDGKTACFCIMQTLAVEGWQAQWPICYICHICYIFDIFHMWDIFHVCDICNTCNIFRMWTLYAFVSVCSVFLCMICWSFSACHSDLSWPADTCHGYLFYRNFGNMGTWSEISENLGSLPKISEIWEEFTRWLSPEDDHCLALWKVRCSSPLP